MAVDNHRFDAIVIGGGLVGLSAARSLRLRGLDVLLLEATSVARHASSASAGGVRSLNRHPAEIALVRAALPMWSSLSKDLGHPCGFQVSGQLCIAEDEAAVEALQVRSSMTRELGYTHERWIDTAELYTRLPDLASHCHGALVVDDDGFADPLATVHAYRQACTAAGVCLLEGISVQTISSDATGVHLHCHLAEETDHDATSQQYISYSRKTLCTVEYSCRYCINAAGAWGAVLSATAGEPVPLTPVALQMAVTQTTAPFISSVLGCHGRKLSLKQTAAGSVVIGGGFEGYVHDDAVCGLCGSLNYALAAQNLANTIALFPHLQNIRVLRQWTGIEGMVSDGLPVVGPSRQIQGLVHAFGFSAHGFAMVPLVGALVADIATGENVNLSIDAFAVDRFKHDRSDQSV